MQWNSSDTSFPYCFTNTFLATDTSSASAFGYGCESLQMKGSIIVPTFVMTDVEGAATTFYPVNEETNTELVAAATFTNAGFPAAATTLFSEGPTNQLESSHNLIASQGASSSSSGPASSSSSSSSSSSASSVSSSSSSQPSSLSPAIVAVIAVLSVVVVALLAALTTFLILRVRKRNRARLASGTPLVGPYTQTSPPFVQPQTSSSNPSTSIASPYSLPSPYPPPAIPEMEGYDYTFHRPALNGYNLDAISRSSGPRGSDEIARERRLSEDGNTAIPEPSVAGRTNWTTDSFNIAGRRRGGY